MTALWMLIAVAAAIAFVVLAIALVIGLLVKGRGPAEEALPTPKRGSASVPEQSPQAPVGFTLLDEKQTTRRERRQVEREASIFDADDDAEFRLTGDSESR